MKKVMLALGVVAFVSLASCKKDYTCTCTIDGESVATPYNDVKKSDAEDACDALNTQFSAQGGSCSLD